MAEVSDTIRILPKSLVKVLSLLGEVQEDSHKIRKCLDEWLEHFDDSMAVDSDGKKE